MKKEEIHLGDWQRILVGEVPGSFYVELIIRVAVVYLILIVAMRLMGKRMASQLSRTEMMAMMALAASIGIPVMVPDRGLLPAVISAAVIVTGQRLLSRWSSRNEKVEPLVQGDMSVLVSDAVMQLDAMESARIIRERLFSLLSEGIPLLRRSLLGKKQALLYSLGNFYVEVSWDPDYGLRHLHAFRDLDSLTPYLATIDWHEFVQS